MRQVVTSRLEQHRIFEAQLQFVKYLARAYGKLRRELKLELRLAGLKTDDFPRNQLRNYQFGFNKSLVIDSKVFFCADCLSGQSKLVECP